MTQIKHKVIFDLLEKWAPKSLAYDWDNVGLQLGSEDYTTNNIMITLDVTEAVVDEAIKNNVNLIIAHHPLLFAKLNKIDFNTFKGKVIKKLIQHNITVFAAHTNFDIAQEGMNDILSTALNLTNTTHLVQHYPDTTQYGIGKVGYLPEAVTLQKLCKQVKTTFDLEQLKVVGNITDSVKKVAVLGGSGEKFIKDAVKHQADVLITGDITYHQAQDAKEMGLAIIDAGHHIEVIFVQPMINYLKNNLGNHTFDIIASNVNTDPFQFA